MKKIMKILIGTAILLLGISIVSAGAIGNDFKYPSQFKEVGKGNYIDNEKHYINFLNDSDTYHNIWFVNTTNYTVTPYNGNNSVYSYVTDENDCGLLEIIDHNGQKYIVNFGYSKGINEHKKLMDILVEFNKMNNIKPLSIEV